MLVLTPELLSLVKSFLIALIRSSGFGAVTVLSLSLAVFPSHYEVEIIDPSFAPLKIPTQCHRLRRVGGYLPALTEVFSFVMRPGATITFGYLFVSYAQANLGYFKPREQLAVADHIDKLDTVAR